MLRSIFLLSCVLSFAFASIIEAESMNPCSADKMRQAYREMRKANCKNCDKYFHCKGNFNAIHKCGGTLQVSVAELLSNAHDLFGGRGTRDLVGEQEADRYGRSGGNCEKRYLTAVKCFWKPTAKKCQK